MGQYHIEIPAALVDDGRQPDDFGACAHDDEQFEFAVAGKLDVAIVCFHFSTGSK